MSLLCTSFPHHFQPMNPSPNGPSSPSKLLLRSSETPSSFRSSFLSSEAATVRSWRNSALEQITAWNSGILKMFEDVGIRRCLIHSFVFRADGSTSGSTPPNSQPLLVSRLLGHRQRRQRWQGLFRDGFLHQRHLCTVQGL